jgi:hypothetical protein
MTVISKGNNKLGRNLPNVSLTPIKGCVKGVPCAKRCYANKAYRQYPNVKTAWDSNLELALNDHEGYFKGISDYLIKNKPEYFRWHVAGDILDYRYLNSMMILALEHPHTQFLCYTKNYAIVNEYLSDMSCVNEDPPENLVIYLSVWPNVEVPNPHNLRLAYYQDGTETRANGFACPGSCVDCKECWMGLQDVIFIKH